MVRNHPAKAIALLSPRTLRSDPATCDMWYTLEMKSCEVRARAHVTCFGDFLHSQCLGALLTVGLSWALKQSILMSMSTSSGHQLRPAATSSSLWGLPAAALYDSQKKVEHARLYGWNPHRLMSCFIWFLPVELVWNTAELRNVDSLAYYFVGLWDINRYQQHFRIWCDEAQFKQLQVANLSWFHRFSIFMYHDRLYQLSIAGRLGGWNSTAEGISDPGYWQRSGPCVSCSTGVGCCWTWHRWALSTTTSRVII